MGGPAAVSGRRIGAAAAVSPRARARVGLLLGGLLAGCGVLPPPNLQPPQLAFSDVALGAIGLDRVEFELTVAASNPNDVDLPLTDLRCDLYLFEQLVASGVARDPSFTLPRRGTVDVPIEFVVPTSRLLDLVRNLRLRDLETLRYRLAGSARWGSLPFTIPFERAGDFGALRRLIEMLGLRPG